MCVYDMHEIYLPEMRSCHWGIPWSNLWHYVSWEDLWSWI